MRSAPDLVPGSYVDAYRVRRSILPAARAAVLEAMGLAPGERPPDQESVAIAPRGSTLGRPGVLTLEDGSALGRVTTVPSDAPFGYHALDRDDGIRQLLITGPGRCHLPRGLREWGWAVQLPSTRSRRSWGMGDLDDVRTLGRWSASVGAGFLTISPLNAPNPGPSHDPSPYFPSTRRFASPIHLSIDALPGAAAISDLARDARRLNEGPLIDRTRVLALKGAALGRLWEARSFDDAAFAAWRRMRGPSVERWSTFCVLAERFGSGWTRWPEEYRNAASAAVAAVAQDEHDRVAFHAWVQWCLDAQLAEACAELRLIADLPVGVDPGGFDAWDWQAQLAVGASIGVPPDRFNAVGQDWGMPPFVPHRLRQAGYGPFIETLRAQLRHAGGLRLDHVLGLFRLWWVPSAAHPTDGAYVRQHTDELLEIVALESERAGALIVGEDLGTVPPGVRAELRRRRVLSTRLVAFERRAPSHYPRHSFAAVTTHDLPTIAGVWTGADLADQAASGVSPDPVEMSRLRRRLLRAAAVAPDASLETVTLALHRRLAESPAMLVSATLEDALGVARRPNIPGTLADARPNWSVALPVPLEEIPSAPGAKDLVQVLRR